MTRDDIGRVHTLAELYEVIEQDRVAAAALAEVAFANDADLAISSITEISSVACARVLADTQVASAKALIDAEVSVARLSAGAGLAVAEYKRHLQDRPEAVPLETVAGMVAQIGDKHSEMIAQGGRQSVEAIERDAQQAIAKLKEIGNAAIAEIRDLEISITSRIELDAALAAEKLRTFRQAPHTSDEVIAEAEDAARKVEAAADRSITTLRTVVEEAIRNIHATTEEACLQILTAADTASRRLRAAQEKTLETIRTVVGFHME
jgi:hypothetical protein